MTLETQNFRTANNSHCRLRFLSIEGKGKGKFHTITGHKGPERECNYSYIHSLTSALVGVVVQRYAQAELPT
jgi:hypothetical protein